MPRPVTITKERLIECIAKGADCQTAILQMLGLKPRGGNYNTLVTKAKEYAIELPKYSREARRRQLGIESDRRRMPLEYHLVKGKKMNANSIKPRLIASNIVSNECSICKLGPTWNNKPLVLQLDHVDGDHTNNEVTNLRLVCPNCHSQTETFAGKNIKTGLEALK